MKHRKSKNAEVTEPPETMTVIAAVLTIGLLLQLQRVPNISRSLLARSLSLDSCFLLASCLPQMCFCKTDAAINQVAPFWQPNSTAHTCHKLSYMHMYMHADTI
ncbi:hypothetical protein WUBG_02214 [Wuchereria bancrofti]|uniref:Uncharacterized protein n=1 Tax=Wuchereria bancrofti TaxID=6293 RepID=J9FBB2_WUCBA|nr:hypothetical protein WUBG_02214 [Wuchereria bancrofti]